MPDDDKDLILIDREVERQKQLLANTVFQLELIAKLALCVSITQPPKDKLWLFLDEVSKLMLPIAVADFKLHGIDLITEDLEVGRLKVMQVVSAFLKLRFQQ